MKDENGLHMVAWLILAQVSDGWFRGLCALIAVAYGLFGLHDLWKARK